MNAAPPVYGEEAFAVEPVSYRDEFRLRGLRKTLALMIIAAITTIPPVFAWQNEPAEAAGSRSFPTGRFAPRGGYLPDQEESGFLTTVWTGFKRLLAIAITTAGLMLYYPRRGFKRYAVLAGPIIALSTPWILGAYLAGRQEVFRFEIVLVAMASALPGAAVYVWLTWRKGRKLGMVW
jgi:hypothetical protein